MFFKKPENIDEKNLKDLAKELSNGSVQAFHIFYHKYKTDIYHFCYRMLNDKDLADEAFQETFVKVYENRTRFDGNNFKSWVFTIARNTCLNYIRESKFKVEFEEDYLAPVRDKHNDFALQKYIKDAIVELPVSYREVIVLREYEGYSYQEIAEILDVSIALVKIRIYRARVILKEKLQPVVKEIYDSR